MRHITECFSTLVRHEHGSTPLHEGDNLGTDRVYLWAVILLHPLTLSPTAVLVT